ncbi:MAG TPA: hypothetical protein VM711_07360 [Sphingomicrobium sp.]|nr:hypothetical protein [Sphingomicrobium sp.]
MNGTLYVDGTSVEATSGRMLVTFRSGGDEFRFHLPANVAITFRANLMRDGWQVMCAPNAEVVKFKLKRRRKVAP